MMNYLKRYQSNFLLSGDIMDDEEFFKLIETIKLETRILGNNTYHYFSHINYYNNLIVTIHAHEIDRNISILIRLKDHKNFILPQCLWNLEFDWIIQNFGRLFVMKFRF